MNEKDSTSQAKPIIGISACLTGQLVRYDGGHKKSSFCVNDLAQHVDYRTFCPEVAIGLPIPRPTIRQIRHGDVIHVSRPDGSDDVTDALNQYSHTTASQLTELSGFIFTANSPSCGMERVKIYHQNSHTMGVGSDSSGVGLFARAVMAANPLLPCEENGRLNDAVLRENFILRVYAYHRWQQMVNSNHLTKHNLYQFHSQYKYLLMSHGIPHYQDSGRLLGQSELPLDTLAASYIKGLMAGLKIKATRKSHTNTLQHLQGYFSKQLNSTQKAELTEQIMAYKEGIVPLIVPITLLKHYLLEFPQSYLQAQVYFDPYPAALKLRYGY